MHYTKMEGPALEAYGELRRELLARAMKELALPADQIVIRDLRPEDLGLSTSEFTFSLTSAAAWNNLVNTYTIADMRFVGLLGVRYPMSSAQAVTQLKVTRAQSVSRIWQIQGLNFLENEQVYFDDPAIVDQRQQLTIQAYCPTTNAAEKLMLLGVVAEKRGVLLNP